MRYNSKNGDPLASFALTFASSYVCSLKYFMKFLIYCFT